MSAAERHEAWHDAIGARGYYQRPTPGEAAYRAERAAAIRASVERGAPDAVSPDVFTGECDSPPHLAALTTGAGEPVADNAQHVTAEPRIEPMHPDRIDARMAEHERQNRLRRWHEPR